MGTIGDIRIVKKQLREKYRRVRKQINLVEKVMFDEKIFNRLIGMKIYQNAKAILCFVSTDLEIDTHRIIKCALTEKKIVAVPKCINQSGGMEFYIINSFNDLEISTFGLLEPKINACKKLIDYDDSICILPGFVFDNEGYRIGYGKGYYDRFLNKYQGTKIGVCYNNCLINNLPHGKYDVAADFIITPKFIMTLGKKYHPYN